MSQSAVMSRRFFPFLSPFAFLFLFSAAPIVSARAEFSSLNMGLDYRLRAVGIENNDFQPTTKDRLSYYSQSARFYMTSWLNQDVEASFRLHSIGFWGMEGSTQTPVTRYPRADGTPWVEEAYIHLPHLFWKRVNVVIGRQSIVIGDGTLVSDDQMGFNAVRAQADLPWNSDIDVFTAKVKESLKDSNDSDLHGAVLGTTRRHNRWELALIQEQDRSGGAYSLGVSTFTAGKVLRRFYDVRLYGDLKDAYYKFEYAMQSGEANLLSPGTNITLKGNGYKGELGAQADNAKWGRFGVRALYAVGSGDDVGSAGTDEAFRPTFAGRWDGLQRKGYGTHYAATLSDAYEPQAPFSPTATGLPPGIFGIKTQGVGIETTQGVVWTASLDYYIFNSLTKTTGKNDLGSEIDAALVYRYTGFVTMRFTAAYFFPGEVYGNTADRVTRYGAEAHVHF